MDLENYDFIKKIEKLNALEMQLIGINALLEKAYNTGNFGKIFEYTVKKSNVSRKKDVEILCFNVSLLCQTLGDVDEKKRTKTRIKTNKLNYFTKPSN